VSTHHLFTMKEGEGKRSEANKLGNHARGNEFDEKEGHQKKRAVSAAGGQVKGHDNHKPIRRRQRKPTGEEPSA